MFGLSILVLFCSVGIAGYEVGTPISDVTITSHQDYNVVFAGSTITLACTTSTDMDYNTSTSQDEEDTVTHTWSGSGVFDTQTGTSVSWTAPGTGGQVTLTVTADDSPLADDASKSDSVILAVQNIIYVDKDATGNDDGTSWANAFADLQDALGDANYGNEIWVAEGTYKPTTGTSREISFVLVDGIKVYGGFVGTEATRSQRDWETNETILSGDIGTAGVDTDNSWHVVVGPEAADPNTSIDGFTVTKGYADGEYPDSSGAGIYVYDYFSLGIVIENCVVTDNYAEQHGAGIYLHDDSIIIDCTISNNETVFWGGGIYCSNGAPHLEGCIISDNESTIGGGGGMWLFGSAGDGKIIDCIFKDNTGGGTGGLFVGILTKDRPLELEISNCIFSGNSSGQMGGALEIHAPYNNSPNDLIISNCIFSENSTLYNGGAIYFYSSSPKVENCTFVANSTRSSFGEGGAIFNRYDVKYGGASPVVTNCIFWDNIARSDGNEIYNQTNCDPTVSYCDIEGGLNGVNCGGSDSTDGGGNIDSDPSFMDLANENYHLLSYSPCIDAGDPAFTSSGTDIDGDTRIVDVHSARVDIGADEAAGGYGCLGDVNGSGNISVADLSALVAFLSPEFADTDPAYTCAYVPVGKRNYDANLDGKISGADQSVITAFLVADYADTDPPYTAPAGVCVPAYECLGDADQSGQITWDDIDAIDALLDLYSHLSDVCPFVPAGLESYDVDGDGEISEDDVTEVTDFLVDNYANTTPPYTAPAGVCIQ